MPNLSESEGAVERTGTPDEQIGEQPDHIPSDQGKSSSTSSPVPKPHGSASALQINIRKCSDMETLQQSMQVITYKPCHKKLLQADRVNSH